MLTLLCRSTLPLGLFSVLFALFSAYRALFRSALLPPLKEVIPS
jgi:hypothetical protein